jgi:hypothetical protein
MLVSQVGTAAPAHCPKRQEPQIHFEVETVDPGGGVIVEMRDEVHQTNVVRFRQGNHELTPTVRAIAPGLDVYEVPPTGSPDIVLLDSAGHDIGRIQRNGNSSLLQAPKVQRLVWDPETTQDRKTTNEMESYGNLGPETEVVTAYIEGEIPERAFGLVISRVDRHGNVVPAAWGLVYLADQVFIVTQSCRTSAPFVRAGDRVVLTWIDRSGRLGAQTRPTVVWQRSGDPTRGDRH